MRACVYVCMCVLALVLFSAIAGNIPQMTVTQISGGRRKLWCDWVIFSWTTCSVQHDSYSNLYKNVMSPEKKNNKKSPLVRDQCCCTEQACLLTFHGYRWHLLYVFEEKMQPWCDIVQWKSKVAGDQQCSSCSIWMHRPWAEVIDWYIRLQSSSHLFEIHRHNNQCAIND